MSEFSKQFTKIINSIEELKDDVSGFDDGVTVVGDKGEELITAIEEWFESNDSRLIPYDIQEKIRLFKRALDDIGY